MSRVYAPRMALVVSILLALFVLPAPWAVPVVVAGIVIEVAETWVWWKLSHRRRPKVGLETLIGAEATVVTACRPTGQVRVNGELWRATCVRGADEGDVVRVVGVDGLELHVGH